MSSPGFQSSQGFYTVNTGIYASTLTQVNSRAPTSTDVNYRIGTRWVWVNNAEWTLLGLSSVGGVLTATWVPDNSVTTTVTAAASPQTSNTRFGSVTFSGVSIAAGATQSFVINNSNILSSANVIAYSLSGATTGAALTIQSITNAAGTSTIVVQNGTGATTTTANITLVYQMLN